MSSYYLDPHARCPTCGHMLGTKQTPLTKAQAELYAYLCDHVVSHGYAPSFAEIGEAFGYRSMATVHEHLTNLEKKGWIRRGFNRTRAITPLVEVAAA